MRGFRVQPNNDRISMRKRSKNRAEIHREIHKKSMRKSPRKCQENSTEKHHKNHLKKYQKSLKKHSKNKVEKRDPKRPPRTNDLRRIFSDGDPLLPQTPSSQGCLTAPRTEMRQALSVTYYLLLTTYY